MSRGVYSGIGQFLAGLAHVTTSDGTAVPHSWDPTVDSMHEMLGFRADPTPGLAHPVQCFEYEHEVGEGLYVRLFSLQRPREATQATGWAVKELRRPHDLVSYRAALENR